MSGDETQSSSATHWQGRPVLGRALQVTLFVFPFVLGLFVSYAISQGIATPPDRSGQIVRILFLMVISFVVMMATDRVARLAAPVALLLRMTMVFPDKAPSRIRVAMRSSSDDELRRTMAEVNAEGLGKTANEAAETLMVLVSALNRHDRLTRGHSERTRAYADVIAGEMGLTTEERSKLRWAALLHDVGKMQIPGEILNKPGRLTETEYEIVKQHPLIGAELVEPLREFLGPWADAVAQHHERWDGGGYPYGLERHEICVGARIVAVADTFDVITSLRSYKKAAPAGEAREEIARCSGTQFDPEVVKAFLAISLGRFRWGLAPLSILTQIPQLVAIASPVAGSMTTVATATPVVMAGAITMGAVAVAAESQPVDVLAASDEISVVEDVSDGSTAVVLERSATGATSSPPADVDSQTQGGNPPTSGASPTTLISTPNSTTTEPSAMTGPPGTTTSVVRSTNPPVVVSVVPVPPTTVPPRTVPPTTVPPTTVPFGNRPDGVLPRVIGDCLGEPGVTAAELRGRGKVEFHGCDLGADGPLNLAGFDLSDAHFHGGIWDGVILDGADLYKAELHDLSMNNASFLGADVEHVSFRDFSLRGVDFRGTDLTDAKFERGDLRGATFASAVIDHVDFNHVDAGGSSFAGATITESNMKGMGALNSSFVGATLWKVNLERATLRNANLTNSSLDEVKFQHANIRNAMFARADFNDVNFDNATGEAQLGSSGEWDEVKCPDGEDETPYRTCNWIR
ncbi:MAG: pentapeptide repeat-containing protein [Acidimicrobiia bacterium]|nr:pentapeptide repeat-containing protein [Acidimicrobiia bacterium]